MESSGMSDASIIGSFVMEYGQKILRPDPSSWFWVVPYLALGVAGFLLVFVLWRAWKRPGMKLAVPSGPAPDNDPELARYRDAIEKETSKLD
jgi:cytochrome c-type biogenesis protein CcmH/NrfF